MSAIPAHIQECPVCRSPLIFQSESSGLIVCGTCNSSIERYNRYKLSVSTIPVIDKDDDVSLLRTGVTGKWKEKNFKVTGRLKCGFGSFTCNRWTLLFSNGQHAVLIETAGFWAIGTDINCDFPERISSLKTLDIGSQKVELIKGVSVYIFSKAACDKKELEGEVITTIRSNDFRMFESGGNIVERLEIIELPNKDFEFRKIEYVSITGLELSSLSTAQNSIRGTVGKMFSCAACNKSNTIKVPAYTSDFICTSCNAWNEIDLKGNITKKGRKFGKITIGIPLGTKGIINGIEYEVTGITQKCELPATQYKWREYSLFNQLTGYAFLSEFNGHWIYLKEIKQTIPWPLFGTEIPVDGNTYLLYNQYGFKVQEAAGEFFGSLNSDNIQAKEYISSGKMILLEKEQGRDIVLYEGVHVDEKILFDNLGLQRAGIPEKFGVGALQSLSFSMDSLLMKQMTIFILVAFLVLQIILNVTSVEKVLFTQEYDLTADSAYSKGISTISFELKKWKSNIQFTLSSPVSNSWFEASVTLVNDKTGEEFSFEKGVEYYSGYEGGEKWTEGSTNADIILSSIPAGKYHLNIFPSFDTGNSNRRFYITATNDVPMWRNFFIIVLIALLYPGIQWLRYAQLERRRWNNSDYSPYTNSDE